MCFVCLSYSCSMAVIIVARPSSAPSQYRYFTIECQWCRRVSLLKCLLFKYWLIAISWKITVVSTRSQFSSKQKHDRTEESERKTFDLTATFDLISFVEDSYWNRSVAVEHCESVKHPSAFRRRAVERLSDQQGAVAWLDYWIERRVVPIVYPTTTNTRLECHRMNW